MKAVPVSHGLGAKRGWEVGDRSVSGGVGRLRLGLKQSIQVEQV